MYQIYHFGDEKGELIKTVRKFDWSRDIPGGWLKYGPPRKVCAFGDGSYYKDSGKKYGKKWEMTSWSGSVPHTDTTAVVETEEIPKPFLETGILGEVRKALRLYGADVDDASCTGIWCNYYDKPTDTISPHTDDENYYDKNYKEEKLFVSLTLYEDEKVNLENLARFQIKSPGGWSTVQLPHLSLLVMSGGIEHRVLKYSGKNFRKRYNITFRTPIKREMDVIKNYRFFSNFGRYYKKTKILYVPEKVFVLEVPKFNEKLKFDEKRYLSLDKNGKKYKLIEDKSNYETVIKEHGKFGNMYLQLNDKTLSREELMEKIREFYPLSKKPPLTTTKTSLKLILKEL